MRCTREEDDRPSELRSFASLCYAACTSSSVIGLRHSIAASLRFASQLIRSWQRGLLVAETKIGPRARLAPRSALRKLRASLRGSQATLCSAASQLRKASQNNLVTMCECCTEINSETCCVCMSVEPRLTVNSTRSSLRSSLIEFTLKVDRVSD